MNYNDVRNARLYKKTMIEKNLNDQIRMLKLEGTAKIEKFRVDKLASDLKRLTIAWYIVNLLFGAHIIIGVFK